MFEGEPGREGGEKVSGGRRACLRKAWRNRDMEGKMGAGELEMREAVIDEWVSDHPHGLEAA